VENVLSPQAKLPLVQRASAPRPLESESLVPGADSRQIEVAPDLEPLPRLPGQVSLPSHSLLCRRFFVYDNTQVFPTVARDLNGQVSAQNAGQASGYAASPQRTHDRPVT